VLQLVVQVVVLVQVLQLVVPQVLQPVSQPQELCLKQLNRPLCSPQPLSHVAQVLHLGAGGAQETHEEPQVPQLLSQPQSL